VTTREGEWLHLDDVMGQIVADATEAVPAIAFAISGGGATGAYEAGVLEAWLRLAASRYPRHRFLTPRIILGSSAGALNAVTTLVAALRPDGGPGFGYEVWRAISPRSAPFVVGRWRTPLVDLATRWLKIPLAVIVVVSIAILAGTVFLLTPKVAVALGAAAAIAIGLLFRRAVFLNGALTRTVACVLAATLDEKTGRIPRRSLRRRVDPLEASATFVKLWYQASEATGGGVAAEPPPNLIVTSTDLTNGAANLFTLVEPRVFARLVAQRWQAMQLMDPDRSPSGYGTALDRECGWVRSDQFVTCVVASTSIPGVFPSQRIALHGTPGNGDATHDFVDGGVLNNAPIHIAIDAGATHVVSFELEPLKHISALHYLAEGDPPSLGRNVVQTFETLLAHSTSEGIHAASSWNRSLVTDASPGAPGKRLVPIYRMAPRRRDLNLIDFNGHYQSAFSGPRPTLEQWLSQGLDDAAQKKLFWNATFEADPGK
jgi:predicted acylesterase/phospholipase RssA